jgi:hypothetical protein
MRIILFCLMSSLLISNNVRGQIFNIYFDNRKIKLNKQSYQSLDSICEYIIAIKPLSIGISCYFGKKRRKQHFEMDRYVLEYITKKTGLTPRYSYDNYYFDGENFIRINVERQYSIRPEKE